MSAGKISVGKIFTALPVALYWLGFVWAVVFMLSNPSLQQNTIVFWFLVTYIPIWFLVNVTGTILIFRHIKNSTSSLD
jgi:hypothetical protein